MILGKYELISLVRAGVIAPPPNLNKSKRPNECAIDLHLGKRIDCAEFPLILNPGEAVNVYTEESFDMPDDLIGIVSARSFWAKQHVDVLNSIFIKPGWKGILVLEVKNNSQIPAVLSKGDTLANVVFARVSVKEDILKRFLRHLLGN